MGRGKKNFKAPKEEEENYILKLPSHITLEILSRLPYCVKTIALCACVCKAWRTLVLDPCFPQLHLAKSPVSFMLFGLYRNCWLIEFEKDFRKRKMSKFEFERIALNVVGSCNGLLCLSIGSTMHVWNPVMKDCITLPLPNIKSETVSFYEVAEFGFCPRTNLYKVIRMVEYSLVSSNKAMCEVCTLGTNACWRTIEDVPVPARAKGKCGRIGKNVLNGAVHWFCSFGINDEKFPFWICAFRIQDEKWDPILLPLSLLEGPNNPALGQGLYLGVLENCLAIFDESHDSLLDIWMMKDYGVRESWTKCWSIEQTQMSYEINVRSLLPIKLAKDGD